MLKIKKNSLLNPNDVIRLGNQVIEEEKIRSQEEIAYYLKKKHSILFQNELSIDELRFACKAYAILGKLS
jgi:hypothetical protein